MSRSSAWRPSAVTPGRPAARASPSCTATSRGSPRCTSRTAGSAALAAHRPRRAEREPGSVAFVAVMLGRSLFDGYSRTTTWQDLVARVEGPYIVDDPTFGELLVTLLNIGGLLTGVLLVALAYQAACAAARWTVNSPRSLTGDFLFSLVPIAFVYMSPITSRCSCCRASSRSRCSPTRWEGLEPLRTAHVTPDLTVISPNTTWYVQVGALVAGHVAGLAVAHDRAITMFPARRDALRSQYALLALMVSTRSVACGCCRGADRPSHEPAVARRGGRDPARPRGRSSGGSGFANAAAGSTTRGAFRRCGTRGSTVTGGSRTRRRAAPPRRR